MPAGKINSGKQASKQACFGLFRLHHHSLIPAHKLALVAIIAASFLVSAAYAQGDTFAFFSKFGSPGTGDGQFDGPTGIAVNSTHIFVVDVLNHRIQIFDHSGNFKAKFGSFGTGDGLFNRPHGITVNSTHIIVADTFNHRTQIFDHSGNFKAKFGSFGTGDGLFNRPHGITVNSTHIFVADTVNHRIQIFDHSGNFKAKFGSTGTGDGLFNRPHGITVNSTHIIVADALNDRIQIFDHSGNFKAKFGSTGTGDGEFDRPVGIAVNSARIIVVDSGNSRIQIFDHSGNFKAKFGTPGSGDGQFNTPFGIEVSSGTIFVTDTDNNRVQLFKPLLEAGSPPAAPESGGDGGCSGDCTPPSFSTGFGKDEYPLAIGGITYPTLGFYNEKTETAILKTNTKTQVRLLVFEDYGPDNVSHISLYMNLRGLEREIQHSDAYIRHYSGQDLEVGDPNGFFSSVSFSSSQKGNKLEATFYITFAKPMETSDLILYAWDSRANAVQVRVLDALEVIPSENIPEEVAEQQTAQEQTTQDTASLVTQEHQVDMIERWAGYVPQEDATDSQLLEVLGFEGQYIPHWVKRFFGEGIYSGQLGVDDLSVALRYLAEIGIVK